MSRQIMKESELVLEINYRFANGGDLDGDCRDIKINGVQRYPVTEESDCNWNVMVFNDPGGCQGVFRAVIDEFRSRYNLPPD